MEKSKAEILLETIKEHNNAYRAGIQIVTDAEYDKEVEELKKIDPENAWFRHIEPAPVGEARKLKLPIPMKSLNKVKDMDSINNWIKSIGLGDEDMIVITPKFDGLSLLRDEISGTAYSRGGAENEGQDCTAHINAASIVSKPSKLHFTFGEFVFNRNSWENNFAGQISKETGEKYKSPRNTAAGLINRDQPSQNLKYIDFFRYGTDEESLQLFNTYVELYTYLCNNFDQPFLYKVVRVKDIEEEDLVSTFDQFSKEYYIDGLVLYANDLSVWKRVGRQETTGNPNYAIAYKNPEFTETFQTTVKSITWKISKSGALKPVVNIDMVNTGDCDMENPTGYNAKYIFENNIAEGATVKVTRSGGVIPKILEVTNPAGIEAIEKMRNHLSVCPACGAPTSWNDNNVELCCTNPDCQGVKLAKIVFFYKTVDAEDMGEETITKMFNAGYNKLRYILDITFEELMQIDGFGESISNSIMQNNARIRQGIEITKLMHASDCFKGIGEIKSQKILDSLSAEIRQAFVDGMLSSPSRQRIESEAFKAQTKTMRDFELGISPFYQFIAENYLQVLPLEIKKQPTSAKYHGVKVCFTGIRDKELEREITEGGGDICSNVTKTTTHLIIADYLSQSTKMQKAKALGISILTIEDFKRRFQNHA